MAEICWFTIAYFISLLIFLHVKLPITISALILGIYIILLLYYIFKQIKPNIYFILAGGILWGAFICSIQTISPVSINIEEERIIFDGYIRGSPAYNEKSTIYQVNVERYISNEKLHIKNFEIQYIVSIPFSEPISGDLIRGRCRLLKGEEGRIICISREDEPPLIIERRKYSLNNSIDGYKEQISRFIYNKYKGTISQILIALSTGNSGNLTYDTRRIFSQSGTSHILAISGTHIGLIAIFLYYFIRLILLPLAILHPFSIRKVSSAILIPLLIIISFYFGNTPSVVRATVMIIIYLFSVLIERERDLLSSLCLAFILITSFGLDSIKDIGFQLSFLSVLGIITFVPSFTRSENLEMETIFSLMLKPLKILFLTSLAASLFTIPVIAYHFGIVSIIGIISNILLVPFAGLICLPLILCGVLSFGISERIGEFFLNGAFVSLKHFFSLNALFASLPISHIKLHKPYSAEIVLYFILIAAFILREHLPFRRYVITSLSVILILTTLIADRIEKNRNEPFLMIRRGIIILYDDDRTTHLVADRYATSHDKRRSIEFLRKKRIMRVGFTNVGLEDDLYIKDHLYTTSGNGKIEKSENGDILLKFSSFYIFVYNDLSTCPPSSARYVISRRSSEEATKKLSECGIKADSLIFAGELKNDGLRESIIRHYGGEASKILICKDEDCEINITQN